MGWLYSEEGIMVKKSDAENCVHHWSIQAATGPQSKGECLNCGEQKQFQNYVEASTWGESSGIKSGAKKAPAEAKKAENSKKS